ncbi:MAG TPA: ATP-binding protein [Labilithrix sp.]|nr:ATP-binding protein [Labilithrix sp.]
MASWVYAVERCDKLRLIAAHQLPPEMVDSLKNLSGSEGPLAVRCANQSASLEIYLGADMDDSDRLLLHRLNATSIRAVPLVSCGDQTGVLLLALRADQPLREKRVEVVASLLALALGAMQAHAIASSANTRLERTIQTTHELADFLARVPAVTPPTRTFVEGAPKFDVEGYFHRIVEHARDLAGAELAAIGVAHSADQPFDPWVYIGVSEKTATKIGRRPRPVGTLGAVALEGQAIRVDDLRAHPAFVGLPAHHPQIRSLLAIPLRAGAHSVGNLYLANKRYGDHFEDDDQRTIGMLGALAASGLRLSTLLDETERDRMAIREILWAIPDAVMFVDAKTGDLLTNPAFDAMTGDKAVSTIAAWQELGMLRHPDGTLLAVEEQPSSLALRGNALKRQELLLAPEPTRSVPVVAKAAPVRASDGSVVGAVVVLRDISEHKELERVRKEFSAMVVHDLRNPIQAILMGMELAQDRAARELPVPTAILERVRRSAEVLASIVRDLLDATRIELSCPPLQRAPMDVVATTQGVIERMRPTVGDHRLVFAVKSDLPKATLDATRFEQILTNLIENAVKYSPAGTPVAVAVARDDGGVEVAVEDKGFGIPEDEIPKLFDRFYQAQRARERRTGLGLGLYITKGFVEAHGGHIRVESKVNVGSTFRVWFPLKPPSDTLSASPGAHG